MQKFILILFFLVPSVFAQTADQKVKDDSLKNPTSDPTPVACGQPNSNHSVPTLQVQDQDGLGTCYANQASLLIQNITQSSSPVSYQQIGMAYAMSKSEQNLTHRTGYTSRHVVEAGNGCHAFRSAQETGFCQMNSFNGFEHSDSEDPNWIQQLVLNSMSAFIDNHANSTQRLSDEQWRNIENQFVSLLATREQECKNPAQLNSQQFARRASEAFYLKVQELKNSRCDSGTCSMGDGETLPQARRDQLLSALEVVSQDVVQSQPLVGGIAGAKYYDFKPAFRTSFDNIVSTNANFSTVMASLLRGSLASKYSNMPANLQDDFSHFFPESFFYKTHSEAYAVSESCNQRWSIADKLENVSLSAMASQSVCPDLSRIDSPRLSEFQTLASDLVRVLRRQESGRVGTLSERLNSLMRILAPTCESQLNAGKAAIRNLKCVYYSLDGTADAGPGSNNKMLRTEFPEPEARRQAATNAAVKALCDGKAVGVDVCTGFMTAERNVNTNFCQNNNIPGVAGHGYHAMTIVSFQKDAAGKTRYLVQNSWGRGCNLEGTGTGADKKDIECEKVKGRPTGRFWVTEELLWNNTTNMNIVMSGSATP